MIGNVLSAIRWRWRCHRAVATARRDTRANLSAGPFRRILVVCYGNIYRSPFVAVRLRQLLGEAAEVRSGGLHPRSERPSPERHVTMSAARGIDLAPHRSAVIRSEDVRWADLIVLMDRHNWQGLLNIGAPAGRLVWLGALDDGPVEIPDPYGLDEQTALGVLDRLEVCSLRLARLATQERADGTPG